MIDVAFIYLYKYLDVLYIILDIYHLYMCNIYFIYMSFRIIWLTLMKLKYCFTHVIVDIFTPFCWILHILSFLATLF